MAYTTIDKSSDYFNTKLYTGTGTSPLSITGVGFQPDFLWIKRRNSSGNHRLTDIVRGVAYQLESSNAEAEKSSGIGSFDSDGWTFNSTGVSFNTSGGTYVGWNWLAGGTAVSNTQGSITSSVSANTTAGFSIVGYTGTGANASVGHGLGVSPDCIIVKRREDAGRGWWVYHKSLGATKAIYLHDTASSFTNSWLQNTAPTSTVFTLNSNGDTNGSSKNHIAYCFAEKKGYSKFGSYTGNGNADGTFVYTGFKPAWVMYKITSGSNSWVIQDTKRSTTNVMDDYLLAEKADVEASTSALNIDFLSNGFKFRNGSNASNASGNSYIYMAFAENPFVTSTGIPCTAR